MNQCLIGNSKQLICQQKCRLETELFIKHRCPSEHLRQTRIKTTLYLGGAIFENDTLQFVVHEEGRIRPTAANTFAFDYYLKDWLGNVRMVLTDEQKMDVYPKVTFETANKTNEQLYYDKVDVGVTARPAAFGDDANNGSMVQLLRKNTQSIGAGGSGADVPKDICALLNELMFNRKQQV